MLVDLGDAIVEGELVPSTETCHLQLQPPLRPVINALADGPLVDGLVGVTPLWVCNGGEVVAPPSEVAVGAVIHRLSFWL